MDRTKDFFVKLGFNFEKKLELKKSSFEDSPELTKKLEKAVFFYNNPNQTSTSFYLIN